MIKHHDQKLSPVSDIIQRKPHELNKEELIFCCQIGLKTLAACNDRKYSFFDALTTTNCCHGISILTYSLLLKIKHLDLASLMSEGARIMQNLETNELPSCEWFLPNPLLDLARLHILTLIKEIDIKRRWCTAFKNLQQIARIGTNQCRKIIANLQTYFSNLIAENYYIYSQTINGNMLMCDIPVHSWGKYIHPNYIRSDKRGRKYAACMYSMQISLAYLIQISAKIAVINDLRCSKGYVKGRYIQILQGDGHSKFRPLDVSDIEQHNDYEPIIIFGGCAYSDVLNEHLLRRQMEAWVHRFPQLVLACDIYYPQFPNVGDDPDFDNTPITPEELCFKEIISAHSKIRGVSIEDASLFCLAHIYPASLKQVLKEFNGERGAFLDYSFIPELSNGEHTLSKIA